MGLASSVVSITQDASLGAPGIIHGDHQKVGSLG